VSLIVWYVIMGVSLIGMIWCAKNQKRFAYAQPCAIACLALTVISAAMALGKYFGNGEMDRLINNAKQFELAKADQVAKFISKQFAGKKVVLLVKSDMLKNNGGSSINVVEEVKKRLNGVDVLETVVIPVTDPSSFTGNENEPPPVYAPEEELSVKVFNAKFEECKKLKPDLIINLAGMPFTNPEKLKIWKWTNPTDPKVILYEANSIGESFIPDNLLNVLAAAVLSKREVKFPNGKAFDFAEDTVPDDLKQTFDLRFVIVTAENVEDLINKNLVYVTMPEG